MALANESVQIKKLTLNLNFMSFSQAKLRDASLTQQENSLNN
jgi:hypothetical protein